MQLCVEWRRERERERERERGEGGGERARQTATERSKAGERCLENVYHFKTNPVVK